MGNGQAAAGYQINDPEVVREIEAEFARYDKALGHNDVAALNLYFFDSPTTVRFGHAENLFGFEAIAAFRASVPSGAVQKRDRTVITTFGKDFATVATLTKLPRPDKIGRTMQTWVRFPQGWRIVAAHVSAIDNAGEN